MKEEILTHGSKKETYSEFIEKFKPKPKLTTDDCYTPPKVYEVVKNYAVKKYGIDPATIIRPFKPGGDYQSEDYNGKVVVDNPPFSIISKIVNWYEDRGIPFFLFCPALVTQCMRNAEKFGFVIVNAIIVYENGAIVKTAFVTNMQRTITLDGKLSEELRALKVPKKRPKKPRPENVYTSVDLITMVPKDARNVEIIHREKYLGPIKFYGGALEIKPSNFKSEDIKMEECNNERD